MSKKEKTIGNVKLTVENEELTISIKVGYTIVSDTINIDELKQFLDDVVTKPLNT